MQTLRIYVSAIRNASITWYSCFLSAALLHITITSPDFSIIAKFAVV